MSSGKKILRLTLFVGTLGTLSGSEYLLDDYYTYGNPIDISHGNTKYSMQYYQGKRENDYTLRKDNKVCLFHNGVLKMVYQVDEKGGQVGDFTQFENGRVQFVQSFDDIMDRRNFNRIVNHVKGERLEIYTYDNEKLIYRGEFNSQRQREGWGIQYDRESGNMLLEGIWKRNKLVEIIRKIEEEEPNIITLFDQNKIDYIITTSKKGRKPQRHSVQMRRRAVERSIVTMTALDTANALANSLMSNRTVNDVELVDITKI